MTPAAIAKLALRIWAAGMLFVYIPSRATPGFFSIISSLLSGSVADAGAWSMVVMFAAMTIVFLAIWCLAGRLAQRLLPSASPEEGHDYAQWQRWGLVFIGGWSALMACLALENFITNDFNKFFLLSLSFNLIVAIILIFGWDNLTGFFSRNMGKA